MAGLPFGCRFFSKRARSVAALLLLLTLTACGLSPPPLQRVPATSASTPAATASAVSTAPPTPSIVPTLSGTPTLASTPNAAAAVVGASVTPAPSCLDRLQQTSRLGGPGNLGALASNPRADTVKGPLRQDIQPIAVTKEPTHTPTVTATTTATEIPSPTPSVLPSPSANPGPDSGSTSSSGSSGSGPSSPRPPPGISNGDPHLTTLDGLRYDFQAAGEFVAVRATGGAPDDRLEIQLRQQAYRDSRTVTINTAVALDVAGDRVGFYAGNPPTLRINGSVVSQADQAIVLPHGGRVARCSDGTYAAIWPDGSDVQASVGSWGVTVVVSLASDRSGKVTGLLGNFDGDGKNDLTTRDGAVIAPGVPTETRFFDQLYQQFGKSWRVSQAESLFEDDPGKDVADYTDLGLPERPSTVDSLDPARRQAAEARCRAARIILPALLDDCILDLGVTGDAAFVQGAVRAAAIVSPGVVPTPLAAVAAIAPGAPAVHVVLGVPGQKASYTFNGNAGQIVSVRADQSTFGCDDVRVSLLAPDGGQLAATLVCNTSAFLDQQSLLVSGAYTVQVDPQGDATGEVDVQLYNVADTRGTIDVGGPPKTSTITTPGQNAFYTFNGAKGQVVSARASNSSFGCDAVNVALLAPEGRPLGSTGVCGPSAFLDQRALPETGVYTVLVDPVSDATGQVDLRVYGVTDLQGTIRVAGPAAHVTIDTPGQNASYIFSGTKGQSVSVRASNNTFGCDDVTIRLLATDGSQLDVTGVCNSTAFLDRHPLPTTGNYTIQVDPPGDATGQVHVQLYDVVDARGTLQVGGPSTTSAIVTPGQNALYTFAGVKGQVVTARASNNTFGCDAVHFRLLAPDGTQLDTTSICNSSAFLDQERLAATGTYTLLVDPVGDATGQVGLQLYNVTDLRGTMRVDGPASHVAIGTPGENASFTVDATRGQVVSLRITSNTFGCDAVRFRLLAPNGGEFGTTEICGEATALDLSALPLTGTYTLIVDPIGDATGAVDVALSSK